MLHTPARHKIGDVASQALAPAVTLALLAVLLAMLTMAAAESRSSESDTRPNPPAAQPITRPWI